MNVSLTPELEEWVHSKVKTGLYVSSSEVVRDALRLLHQFEEGKAKKVAALRSELLLGVKQLEKGLSQNMGPDLAENIKRSGRKRKHG